MTTKLAVKHTKITSNGQKVNKIKQCAQREHDVPSTGNTGPATSSLSGHGLLWLVLQSAAVPASQQGAQHVASIPSVAAAAVAVGAAPAAVAVSAPTAAT